MTTKKELKKRILNIRDKLSKSDVEKMSSVIFSKVFELDAYKKAKSIFIYNSFGNEVCTKAAIEEAGKTKKVFLPKINVYDEMDAVKVDQNSEYDLNKYGIFEPKTGDAACKKDIDVCIVPGAVFDIHGGRTGYGKAYYDIFLRGAKIYKVGVCYDFQLIDYIPVDLLDVDMDVIITEKRLLVFKN